MATLRLIRLFFLAGGRHPGLTVTGAYRLGMDEPDVSVDTVIDAPADELYAMISDITRMGEWSPENTGAAWKGEATAAEVGARFTGKNANGRKRWSTDCKVVEAEPGKAFAFAVTAVGFKVATWRYVLEPAGSGTRVTEQWHDSRGAIAKALGKPASGVADRASHNQASMEQTLANLKAAVEANTEA